VADRVLTLGFLGEPWHVLTLGFDLAPLPAARDLIEAMWFAARDDSALAAEFGGVDWLWIDEAPVTAALPFAVLTAITMDETYESRDTAGGIGVDTSFLITLTVYATSRRSARDLSELVRLAWQDRDLVWTDSYGGYLMNLRFTGTASESLDPGRGRGGADIWRRDHVIEARIGQTR
jgi:hypothetical protein